LNALQSQVQHEYFFAGRVQGVGFRYTVLQLASGLAITGFVKNLDDGRVHLLVEGSLQEIDQLLSKIQDSRIHRGIRDRTVRCSPATGAYTQFEIRT
jgi:acylphosphatase